MAKERTAMALAALVAATSAALPAVGAAKVSVNLDEVKAEVPRTIYGTGMEDVNHEIYGGLDAQRLWDESFEEERPPQVSTSGYWSSSSGVLIGLIAGSM